MTNNVYIPKRNNDSLNKAFNVAQIVGGAASGNPMMAVGGVVGLAGNKSQGPQSVSSGGDSAINRRLQEMSSSIDEQLTTLRDAEVALNTLPPEYRQKYTKPLFQTMLAVHNKMNGGGQA